MSDNKHLGKGLSVLLGDDDNESVVKNISIGLVAPNKEQPRTDFNEDSLQELSNSIKEKGILQPILVRKSPYIPSSYEIVAGERRWRAAKLAKLKEVPVIVRDFSDNEVFEAALIENVQRENLNPVEEAVSYKKLIDDFGYTQENLGSKISKSRAYVTNMLRLLNLPKEVIDLIKENKISKGHAKVLVSSDKPKELAEKIINESLSVRDIEVTASKNKKSSSKKKKKEKGPEIISLEENVSNLLNTNVEIEVKKNGKGEIRIKFKDMTDLDRLLSRF